MKKYTIYLAILFSIALTSCKKAIEEKFTKEITGEWIMATQQDGTFNPYNEANMNPDHTTNTGTFDDNCGETYVVDYSQHLRQWTIEFKENGGFTTTKIYEIYTVNVQASWAAGCGSVIYKTIQDTVNTDSKWNLDGKKLSIENDPITYEIEEVTETLLLLSVPTMKGNERTNDYYEKIN